MINFFLAEVGEQTLAPLTTLITGIKAAVAWIFSLFSKFITIISTNDLLLYPVLLCIVISAVALAIKIVRKFGMKSKRG